MAEAVTGPSHKSLFRLAYAFLALAFWLSVAGFAYLMTRPNHSRPLVWSAWKPSDRGLMGAHEIASRVAAKYKLPSGGELAAIQEHVPAIQGLKLEAIGVQRASQDGRIGSYVALFATSNTLIYAFCGLQANCAIGGADTVLRQRTLRREALELSLYAFKYLGVEQVVSLVQSTKSSGTSAVFLRKSSFRPELQHPLNETLPLSTPPPSNASDPKEAAVIDALTIPNTFPAHFEPLPDGDAIILLNVATQT